MYLSPSFSNYQHVATPASSVSRLSLLPLPPLVTLKCSSGSTSDINKPPRKAAERAKAEPLCEWFLGIPASSLQHGGALLPVEMTRCPVLIWG